MKYSDVIYATEKIGSNGIHCLDYKNDDNDVKYIRADLAKLKNTPSNNKYTAPQATTKSCPGCNRVATVECLYSRLHTGNC